MGGISNKGTPAEIRFLDFVRNSRKSDINNHKVTIVSVDSMDCIVEIRYCGASTINQIRPIKFIPCAVWASKQQHWHVFSPVDLVRLAMDKGRGQHNEISFECMNLTLSANPLTPPRPCTDKKLDKTVCEAIRHGLQYPNLPILMAELKDKIESLGADYKERVKAELGSV